MSNKEIIDNINIPGKNNDIIDFYTELINSFSDGIKKTNNINNKIDQKLKDLKNKFKNEKILFTQNEKNEIKNLFNLILENSNMSIEQKINKLIEIMDYTIRKELHESQDRKKFWIKKPEDLIHEVKNLDLKNIGKVEESFKGESEYLVIIIPQIHFDNYNQNNNNLTKLKKIQLNILNIQEKLYQFGISKVFSLEGHIIKEFADELPYKIYQDAKINIQKYYEYQKQPNQNKDKIEELELQFLNNGIGFDLENKYKDNIYTFGIEKFESHFIAHKIEQFYRKIITLKKINEQELLDLIDIFLKNTNSYLVKNKFKFGITDNEISICLQKIGSIIIPKNPNNLILQKYQSNIFNNLKGKYNFDENTYKNTIFKEDLFYTFNRRNEDIIKNTQQIYENTHTNAIVLPIGSLHLKNILYNYDVNSITSELKNKQISYIVINPDGL